MAITLSRFEGWVGAVLLALAGLLASAGAGAESLEEVRRVVAQAHSDRAPTDANAWVMAMSQRLRPRLPDTRQRLAIVKRIYREAVRNRLSPTLVMAVIDVESSFKPRAVSKAGARGLMQVMPFWVREVGHGGHDLFDPHTNIIYGCAILRHYLGVEQGNLSKALARYNGSQGQHWYPQRVYQARYRHWQADEPTFGLTQANAGSRQGNCVAGPGYQVCWE